MLLLFMLFFPILFLSLLGMLSANLYEKADHYDVKKQQAFIPVFNVHQWLLITGRPRWWMILLFVPIFNFFTIFIMVLDLLKSFEKRGFVDYLAGIFVPFVYLPIVSADRSLYYSGPAAEMERQNKSEKSTTREWIDALIFAVIAATIIRTFIVEAYTIPTSSMERTLLVGDFLFVSKFHYGARVPNTPVAFPFAHHTMPVIGTKAYSELVHLDYYRLPGLQEIERNDIVVFNYPMEYRERPVDKRENYIKRCVAVPGDKLEIKDGALFVNDEKAFQPEKMQHIYKVKTDGGTLTRKTMGDFEIKEEQGLGEANTFGYHTSLGTANKLQELERVKSSERLIIPKGQKMGGQDCFPPKSKYHQWNIDQYGPIMIPRKGETVTLTKENIGLYKLIITVYEGNKIELRNGKFFINGEETKDYTFKMDYYFMMGDNRHNSLDSRYWGFVPEDHIVGKAWVIWFSLNDINQSLLDKVRWSRLFTAIHGDEINAGLE